MTADVELLPLPNRLRVLLEYEARARVRDYACACVADATAAKDAEIEALRAEVRGLRRQQSSWERHVAAAGCEYVRDEEGDTLVNRRAERLAEALRRYRYEVPLGHQPHMLAHEVDALLRDQEEGPASEAASA